MSEWNIVRSGPGEGASCGFVEVVDGEGVVACSFALDLQANAGVFRVCRGSTELFPSRAELLGGARAAVRSLSPALLNMGRLEAEQLAAALSFVGLDISSWDGAEWAVSAPDGALTWSGPSDGRIPFHWLRMNTVDGGGQVTTYQYPDEEEFLQGLYFRSGVPCAFPEADNDEFRSRRGIPLATGRVRAVEVVYDMEVMGECPLGLVTEILIHTDRDSTLLLTGEEYDHGRWLVHDESVVAVPDPLKAGELPWKRYVNEEAGRRSWFSSVLGHDI